jgi:hypothetical protein
MLTVENIKALCEAAVPSAPENGGRRAAFRLPQLAKQLVEQAEPGDPLDALLELTKIGAQTRDARFATQLAERVIRAAFLLEPVELPGAETTLFTTRWANRLEGDPRFASVDECCEIAERLSSIMAEMLAAGGDTGTELERFTRFSQVPYEIPIDYALRAAPIHFAANFAAIVPEVAARTIGLRATLLDRALVGDELYFVMKEAYDKICTKSYKTDRVLTGLHKTNREKRWECHPDSVHFALRATCMEIELLLVNQLCHFDGFPPEVRAMLSDEGLLLPCETPFRCPVTLDPMSFAAFATAMTERTHGVSIFHVGHLNPLKLETNTFADGHSAGNISWISEDGNRIQGSLSIEQTRAMLERIWHNYIQAGLFQEP